MAHNPRKRAIPGRPMDFPAEVYNELLALIAEKLKGESRGNRETSTEILIRNDTDDPISQRFGILALNKPLVLQSDNESEFAERRAMTGIAPSSDSTIAILMDPASADQIVKATLLGLTPCRVDITNTGHRFAGPTTSTTALTSSATGPAQIQWVESDEDEDGRATGEQWAIVVLMGGRQPDGFWARLTDKCYPGDECYPDDYDSTRDYYIRYSFVRVSDSDTNGRIAWTEQRVDSGSDVEVAYEVNNIDVPVTLDCAAEIDSGSGGDTEEVTETFSTAGSHSWTCPNGVTEATVECWGGGGNGGHSSGTSGGGGGGGGAYSLQTVSVTPGDSYPLVVGGAAGDSYFVDVSTVLAKGGANGSGTTGGTGGAAGSGVGSVKHSGGNGESAATPSVGGGGGGSSAGLAADGTNGAGGSGGVAPSGGGDGGDATPTGGSGPGGGGGGGRRIPLLAPGSGAAGLVKVTYLLPVPIASDDCPTIVWMWQSQTGNYFLFDSQPRWEFVEKLSDELTEIDGAFYYEGALLRYDQIAKGFVQVEEVWLLDATAP